MRLPRPSGSTSPPGRAAASSSTGSSEPARGSTLPRNPASRTTKPVPVYGNWKTMVRLHDGNSLTALPIYLPRDAAIPVGEVPAPAHFTRAFGSEHKLLQREQKGGSPVLVAIAYSTVAAITLSLLVLLAWALHRLAVGMRPAPRRRRP